MDWLTFLSGLIESLAWPTATVAIALVFRAEFKSLVPLLKKLKAGPLEAEFEREVRELERESPGPEAEGREPPETTARHHMLQELVRVNPRSAILEAWLDVESAVRRLALQRISTSPPPNVSSPLRTMRELVQWGIVSNRDAALFHDLRGLRNQAAHLQDFSPNQEATLEYVNMAAALARSFTNSAIVTNANEEQPT